jgi:hypothetical protein
MRSSVTGISKTQQKSSPACRPFFDRREQT